MKKLLLTLIIWLAPLAAFAADCPTGTKPFVPIKSPDSPFSKICVPSGGSIPTVLQFVLNTLLGFAGGFALLFLIIGGIRYIVSAGNTDQIEQARSTIYNALIGIVVILLTFVILNTVIGLINP